MYATIDIYGIVHVTVHNTVRIYGTIMWHWSIMWYWLMRCHDLIGLKFLCTVDSEVAAYQWTKNLAYGTCITKDYFQPNRVTVQPGSNRVLLIDDVAQSWISKLFLIWWSWFTQYIYKNGASPPNLASLNLFLDSIFYNSFSILYFLHILINFHFTLSSIMSI